MRGLVLRVLVIVVSLVSVAEAKHWGTDGPSAESLMDVVWNFHTFHTNTQGEKEFRFGSVDCFYGYDGVGPKAECSFTAYDSRDVVVMLSGHQALLFVQELSAIGGGATQPVADGTAVHLAGLICATIEKRPAGGAPYLSSSCSAEIIPSGRPEEVKLEPLRQ